MFNMECAIPHPDLLVTDLEYKISKFLTLKLDANDNWKLVAEAFNEYCGSCIFRKSYIQSLEHSYSPSATILDEIGSRLCTVKLLCEILEKCDLKEPLSLLKEPEQVRIVQEPGAGVDSIDIPEGGTLRLECRAVGLPPPSYVWFQGNVELKDQKSSVLIIRDFREEHEGEYYCQVVQDFDHKNPCIVESDMVFVELEPTPPTIIKQPMPLVLCNRGDDVSLVCVALGRPQPEFEWFKGTTQLLGEYCNTLKIHGVTPDDEGHYRCYIKNKSDAVWSNKSVVSLIYHDPGVEDSVRMTATIKVALLIGNDTYDNLSSLKKPSNDVATVAAILNSIGFKVVSLLNLTRNEMKNAVRKFCSLLRPGGYGLFYFVGHGFELQEKFMLPVDSPGPDSYLRRHSVCEREVIRDVMERKPKLFLMLLDMCLKLPDRKENPSIYKELPETIEFEPQRNLIQQYSTTSNLACYENTCEENGIYVTKLKQHLGKDSPIKEILDRANRDIALKHCDASDKQMPYTCSNVVDDFYLTDSVTGDPEAETEYMTLTNLPPVKEIMFRRVGLKSTIKLQPHRGCFHNSLDVIFTNMEDWEINGMVQGQNLELNVSVWEDCKVITIHNLQKTKISVILTVNLIDPASFNLDVASEDQVPFVDSCIFNLGLPLISKAQLWFTSQESDSALV